MKLKSDAKFQEKLTSGFKYGMRNFVNFHPTTQISLIFHFFCLKYMRFELKITAELYFIRPNTDAKFE